MERVTVGVSALQWKCFCDGDTFPEPSWNLPPSQCARGEWAALSPLALAFTESGVWLWPQGRDGSVFHLSCRRSFGAGLGARGGRAQGPAAPFPHCVAGPIAQEAWQGSGEEAGATAGAECSRRLESLRRAGEKNKTYWQRPVPAGLLRISVRIITARPSPRVSPLPFFLFKTFWATVVKYGAFKIFIPRKTKNVQSIVWSTSKWQQHKQEETCLSRAIWLPATLLQMLFCHSLFWLIDF